MSDTDLKPVEGLRYNSGKIRYDLIPADGIHELADVYTIGAAKYADRNWEKGLVWMETFACLQRHAWKWARGEDYDDETGKHHMAHVVWNAMALLVFALRGIGRDDRPKLAPKIT